MYIICSIFFPAGFPIAGMMFFVIHFADSVCVHREQVLVVLQAVFLFIKLDISNLHFLSS